PRNAVCAIRLWKGLPPRENLCPQPAMPLDRTGAQPPIRLRPAESRLQRWYHRTLINSRGRSFPSCFPRRVLEGTAAPFDSSFYSGSAEAADRCPWAGRASARRFARTWRANPALDSPCEWIARRPPGPPAHVTTSSRFPAYLAL